MTGGTGFIGSHLVQRLAEDGQAVHVLHRPNGERFNQTETNGSAKYWPCDLRDKNRLIEILHAIQPEVIFHLAGDTSVRHIGASLAGVADSIGCNVETSINLFLAAHATCRQLQLLVRVGGLEEYGRGPVPYKETQREQPVSPYSASQVAVTHYLQMLSPHVNYRTVIARPALVYGPRQSSRFFIPALIASCLIGLDFSMTSGKQGRDLLYVDDLIEALLLLRDKPLPTGEIINVGSGRETAMAGVAASIVRLAGVAIQLRPDAPKRPSEIEHLYCSNQKAASLLGWRPAVDLEDGLSRTIEWYRQGAAGK